MVELRLLLDEQRFELVYGWSGAVSCGRDCYREPSGRWTQGAARLVSLRHHGELQMLRRRRGSHG
jgi:hypothetical protein